MPHIESDFGPDLESEHDPETGPILGLDLNPDPNPRDDLDPNLDPHLAPDPARRVPGAVCAVGWGSNPGQVPQLERLEQAYNQCGWKVAN